MKKLLFYLSLGLLGLKAYAAGPAGSFIENTARPQQGAQFNVSSGTVRGTLIVGTVTFNDGSRMYSTSTFKPRWEIYPTTGTIQANTHGILVSTVDAQSLISSYWYPTGGYGGSSYVYHDATDLEYRVPNVTFFTDTLTGPGIYATEGFGVNFTSSPIIGNASVGFDTWRVPFKMYDNTNTKAIQLYGPWQNMDQTYSIWLPTAPPVNNQVLMATGNEGHMMWTSTAIGSSSGSFSMSYVAKTSTYVATASDEYISCTNYMLVLLPNASGNEGKIITIKNMGTGTVTIDGLGSQTIDGELTYIMDIRYTAISVISNGSNWEVF